jgi:hypothetical protein
MTLLTTQQKEAKSIQYYTKQFQVTREVVSSQSGGPIILMKQLLENKAYKVYTTDILEHEKTKNCKNKLSINCWLLHTQCTLIKQSMVQSLLAL